MKDAFGHGSAGRGGVVGSIKTSRVGMTADATFRNISKNGVARTDTQRTVERMRNQLASAQGPGHRFSIIQGIKNLLGTP